MSYISNDEMAGVFKRLADRNKEQDKKILDLPLKKEWYNMIESGTKTEEYREVKPYWIKRLCANSDKLWQCADCDGLLMCSACFLPKNYTHVRFRYGYAKRTITREIESISIGYGKPEWGAPTDKQVFIIKFKKGGQNE